MTCWMSIEVFDGSYAARLWADSHIDTLVEAAIATGAVDWDHKRTAWGVVLEVAFEDEQQWATFRSLRTVQELLDRAPDPKTGLLIYRGRSLDGGIGALRKLRPKSGSGAASLQLPFETAPFVEPLLPYFTDTKVDRRLLTRRR